MCGFHYGIKKEYNFFACDAYLLWKTSNSALLMHMEPPSTYLTLYDLREA